MNMIQSILFILIIVFVNTGYSGNQLSSFSSIKSEYTESNAFLPWQQEYYPDEITISEYSHEHENTTLLGSLPYGDSWTLEVHANHLFYCKDNDIEISDISDPGNPIVISRIFTPGTIKQFHYSNGKLYVSIGSLGLRILDVSDPYIPVEIASLEERQVNHVEVSGNYAFLAMGRMGLEVVDISDPSKPKSVKLIEAKNSFTKVFLDGKYAYANDDYVLRVFDISNPLDPQEISAIDNKYHYTKDIAFQNDTLYCTLGYGNLRVVDMTDHLNPLEIVHFDTTGYWEAITKSGSIIFVSDLIQNKMVSLDISDISGPVILDEFPEIGKAYDFDIVGNIFFIASRINGIFIYDIKDARHPKLLYQKEFYSYGNDLAVIDSILYYNDAHRGLRVINISNPQLPIEIAHYDLLDNGRTLTIKDSLLFRPSGYNGCYIFDISNPKQIKLINHYMSGQFFNSILIDGNYAYVSCFGSEGFLILDISDLQNIKQIYASEASQHFIQEMVLVDDYLYFADRVRGVFAYDVHDKHNPVQVASFLYDVNYKMPNSIATDSNYVYVASDLGIGLRIFDISVRDKLQEVTQPPFDNAFILDLKVRYPYVYCAVGALGFQVIDVSNSVRGKKVAYYYAESAAKGLRVIDDIAYIATERDGPYIIRFDPPTGVEESINLPPVAFDLEQNYPNPFNSETRFNYQLSMNSRIELSIFNSLGQKIITLADEQKDPGQYSVHWHASNIASGVYFYRLTVSNEKGTFSDIKKCILLK